ncbi:hypothetical protein [Fibrivirga algicola]|uniref:CD-NTase-associated protein 12/Pycsar effector protein TIR domain-containing protein n=1 Tax=Fibrivirga algicola TaxID=2950420 RepID=A0ABX0QNR9_9BACT|nr:hypothetical protein [Fibrivirga algicola]NID13801.1 hypothetical protein [Fibrivirga algicola]
MKNEEKKRTVVGDSLTAKLAENKVIPETEGNDKPKIAFFITPLGGDSSEIRRATDGLIDAVIEPALRRFGIDLIPPHKIKNPGNITRQIVRHILECDLVIANLTGLNANVMYELAIRHARRKPVIVIAENGTVLPFDIAAERTIFYKNDMGGAVELTARLVETIPLALNDTNPENPVYNGLEASIIQEQVEQSNDPVQHYILDKLNELADSVATLRSNSSRTTSPDQTNSSLFSSFESPNHTSYTIRLREPSRDQIHSLKNFLLRRWPRANIALGADGVNLTFIGFKEKHTIPALTKVLESAGFDVEVDEDPWPF